MTACSYKRANRGSSRRISSSTEVSTAVVILSFPTGTHRFPDYPATGLCRANMLWGSRSRALRLQTGPRQLKYPEWCRVSSRDLHEPLWEGLVVHVRILLFPYFKYMNSYPVCQTKFLFGKDGPGRKTFAKGCPSGMVLDQYSTFSLASLTKVSIVPAARRRATVLLISATRAVSPFLAAIAEPPSSSEKV